MTSGSQTEFETVIGLEVHVQLSTQTKMFCGCRNIFGSAPNTNVCPVCMGLPGSLPVVNREALRYAVRIGLALNCEINRYIKFDRKNYYYPDCPKNYQISQFDMPICYGGHLHIPVGDGELKKIGITRAHLEEDAGKLVHAEDASLVDFNRTGTPLLEIVSEPDLRDPQEAYDYLQNLKLAISYLDVSDCDMEKGSLRCDANVSIRPAGSTAFGTKTELKNMNSFKAVRAALEYEISRQHKVVLAGEKVVQETRLWDESKLRTASMRSKEEAHDYRYFPDPDLVPFTLADSEIEAARAALPELPEAKFQRFLKDYALTEYDAGIIIQDRGMADFFETCAGIYDDYKKICNWLNGSVLQAINERKTTIAQLGMTPERLTDLIMKVDDGTISNLVAKDVFLKMLDSGKDATAIIEEEGLAQVSDEGELEGIVDALVTDNPQVVEQIQSGQEKAIGFLVGQAMKKTQGKANPKMIRELITRRLSDG
ncbi:MAG: Asp-tRNA(Asn)/Glu-tRNA(Gln) amidotransferase subunit GatB [Candidatus Omnitrophica bacterium]|nr:Asp-tRNA(Asn)/Glu-tRNA(Gln) amidotransferase subunit GatB [Candidatus Omnitrophota bacterium]MCB9721772.1 Asp-tRNA(Asn)/Glu-tRNA(Gln) amidotransferase subunit GatB [Candidatus Omnitrophota bacterium]